MNHLPTSSCQRSFWMAPYQTFIFFVKSNNISSSNHLKNQVAMEAHWTRWLEYGWFSQKNWFTRSLLCFLEIFPVKYSKRKIFIISDDSDWVINECKEVSRKICWLKTAPCMHMAKLGMFRNVSPGRVSGDSGDLDCKRRNDVFFSWICCRASIYDVVLDVILL